MAAASASPVGMYSTPSAESGTSIARKCSTRKRMERILPRRGGKRQLAAAGGPARRLARGRGRERVKGAGDILGARSVSPPPDRQPQNSPGDLTSRSSALNETVFHGMKERRDEHV